MPKATSIRLSDETLEEIEALSRFHGIKSMTAIVSMAIRRMARADLGAVAVPPVKLPSKTTKRKGRG